MANKVILILILSPKGDKKAALVMKDRVSVLFQETERAK